MTAAPGINVDKANLDVSVSKDPVACFDNATTGITKLPQHLQNSDTVPVVCGPTGGYERRLTSGRRPSEIAVPVDHPVWVRAFSNACGYEAKTHPLDARVLASHKEIARLNQEYQAVLKDNPILAEPLDLNPAVPGVGPLTAPTLVAHLPQRKHQEARYKKLGDHP